MNRSRQLNRKHSYKIGESVSGVQAIIPTKNGREELGAVIYKRKAKYAVDPYKKRDRA